MKPGITPTRERDLAGTISEAGAAFGRVNYNVRRVAYDGIDTERQAEHMRRALAAAEEAVKRATEIREYLRAEGERVTREASR
jgi:hypothetical protein